VVYEDWNYCKEHGCRNCKKVVKQTKGGIKVEDRFWTCSETCKKELLSAENKKREVVLTNLNSAMISNLDSAWNSDFVVDLKELINELFLNKCAAVHANDKTPVSTVTVSSQLESTKNLIDDSDILKQEEKESWKKFYDENKNEDVKELTKKEEKFLTELVTKRKERFEQEEDDRNRERERERAKNLPDWNFLSAGQQQQFIDQINSAQAGQFAAIFIQIDRAIKEAKSDQELLTKKNLVIQEIDQFLLAAPVLNSSELGSNAGWKNEISGASSIGIVNQIKDRVWAGIKAKKAERKGEQELSVLIGEAQVSVNNNDLVKLQKDLEKINAYRNTAAFQKKKVEVENLEKHLFSDLVKYREFIINTLQEELKNEPFPVLVEELKEEHQDFSTKINQFTDRSALENLKNNVLDNVGEKRAEKLVDNLLVQIKKNFTSEAERSTVCQEIYRLRDNGNAWEKKQWDSKREVFEEFLRGDQKKDTPQQSTDDHSLSDYLLPISIIFLLMGLIVAGLVIVHRKLKPFLLSFLSL